MRFARVVFLIVGIYGLLVMLLQYFLESRIARVLPPAITHPEFYYGFIGVLGVLFVAAFVTTEDR